MSQRRRMGPAPRMRPAPPARPVHAAGLAGWERLAFAVVFALMVAFVVAVTIASARARGHGLSASAGAPPPAARARPVPAARGHGDAPGFGADLTRKAWDHRLAAALAPVVAGHAGNLAVGIIDRSTGVVAVYGGRLRFHAASIVKPEILAALLLQRQDARAGLSDKDEGLATQMIETSDDNAARRLWNLAGRGAGVAAADARLGLRHTTPGPGELWRLTTTTVRDQLTLLSDLTAARSPLDSGPRAYELSLMRNIGAAQRWGVSAAASPGSIDEISNGWLRGGPAHRWVVSSIGVLHRDHHRLLMAVLSSDQPTKAAGMAQDEAAAVAAAACVTPGR